MHCTAIVEDVFSAVPTYVPNFIDEAVTEHPDCTVAETLKDALAVAARACDEANANAMQPAKIRNTLGFFDTPDLLRAIPRGPKSGKPRPRTQNRSI